MARLTLRRPRFFYGWRIVLAAGVAMFVSSAFGRVLQSRGPSADNRGVRVDAL